MSTMEKVTEVESLRAKMISGQNEVAKKDALAKGKLTARDRITALFDDDSFVEVGAFVKSRSTAFNMEAMQTPADGVVTGYGTVNGNPVYVYSQDASVMGGALGEMHAKKIAKIYDMAMKAGAPVVGFIDTVGVRLQESVDALEGYGMIYEKMTEASGYIPQVAVVVGDCAGGSSIFAGLADFVMMSTKNARVFLNSPNTLDEKTATFDNVASAKVHAEESGLATVIEDTEEKLIEDVRDLLSYLPQNSEENVPFYDVTDDINRVDPALNSFDFDDQKVKVVMASIADNNTYFELGKDYGQTAVTAFIRLDGGTVGVVANNEVRVDYAGVKKITDFVYLCDSFNIPVVTLTNIEGFESTVATEKLGIVKACSEMTRAFASASVPKINILLNSAFGSSFVMMNSKALGCDMTYAWPTATVSSLKTESAMKIMYAEELKAGTLTGEAYAEKAEAYEAANASAYAAAAKGLVDDIIEPAATRKRIIAALEVLSANLY